MMTPNSEFTLIELDTYDLNDDLLNHFERKQNVTKCYLFVNNEWILKEVVFVEEWSEKEKFKLIKCDLQNCIDTGDAVLGIFTKSKHLIGFSSLQGQKFGKDFEYVQLQEFHISNLYRGLGLGKKLFQETTKKAKMLGAKKLYISSHSAVETVNFYLRQGCTDASLISEELATAEPFDRQMEYIL